MSDPGTSIDLLNLNDDGFRKLYDDRIAPIFATREVERRAALRTFGWRITLAAALALGAGGYLGQNADNLQMAAFVAIAVAVGGFWFAYRPLAAVGERAKVESLSAIAGAVGCSYEENAFDPPAIARFRDLDLLPRCDRDNFEDLFSGRDRDCDYDFYDARLEERRSSDKGGTHWVTVFRGQLIAIAFPKKFAGLTIVRRDLGIFNALQRWTTKLQRVGLGDSRLERAFEVYSNDQVEARYLIHPVFMERLLALEEHFKGGRLRCAFEEGRLLIAIEGKNRFEIGSMFASLNDPSRARSVIDDIAEITRVVDAVLTAEVSSLPPETKAGPA